MYKFFGACGNENCIRCLPLFDSDNVEIPDSDNRVEELFNQALAIIASVNYSVKNNETGEWIA